MKTYIFPLLLTLSICIGCKKEKTNPEVTQPTVEALPSSFTKRILLEDYTKHCQFCIPLNTKVDSMRNSYPSRTLIPVLIAAFHATEIPHYSVMNSILNITVFPVASINRVPAVNSGIETGKLITKKEHWSTNIDSEYLKSTRYGLKINSSLSGNNLSANITIGALEANNDLKLTVYVIEDDAYYRNLTHVLTSSKGDGISLQENGMIEKSYSIDVSGINHSKSSLVAFVHYFNETSKNYEVMNVQEVKLGQNIGW